jgi:hypothetical protein
MQSSASEEIISRNRSEPRRPPQRMTSGRGHAVDLRGRRTRSGWGSNLPMCSQRAVAPLERGREPPSSSLVLIANFECRSASAVQKLSLTAADNHTEVPPLVLTTFFTARSLLGRATVARRGACGATGIHNSLVSRLFGTGTQFTC